ncbi:MAG: hypothetical protein QRY72_03320 [Candidatus Rhabdochlamydia sp.]
MSDIRDCEHYAFKINIHGQFPIPAVFLVEVRGALGTLQPVISQTMRFDDIPDDKKVLILPSLRKLLLFDLLFLNHDRSPSNILYCQEGDSYTCYGIDHEESLKYLHGAYTMSQIELIDDLSKGLRFEDFDTAIQEVCSQKSCDHYQQILKECFARSDRLDQFTKYGFETESEQALLERINDVGRRLRESNQNLSETIDDIQQEMRINPQAGSKTPSQSDPSHLPD